MKLTKFDPDTHTYQIDGATVPSVTQVIGQIKNFDNVPRGALERKRLIGQEVHAELSEFWACGVAQEHSDPDVQQYLAPMMEWIENARRLDDFDLFAWETPLFSRRFRFAGTPDFWAMYRGERATFDPKTIAGALGPEIGLQLAAYNILISESVDPEWKTARRYAVHIRPDGRCAAVEYNSTGDWPTFMSLLNLYNWRLRHRMLDPSTD